MSNVLKRFQNITEMEYYKVARKIRRDINQLLLRDFGLKGKTRKIENLSKMMDADDKKTYHQLMRKYNFETVIELYPEWLIDKERNYMMNLSISLMSNIVAANSIFVTNPSECYERRNYQNRAIINCNQMIQELQYLIDILPIDANKYLPYEELLDKEIALLKGWRKSDNSKFRKVLNEYNQKDKNSLSNLLKGLTERIDWIFNYKSNTLSVEDLDKEEKIEKEQEKERNSYKNKSFKKTTKTSNDSSDSKNSSDNK